MMWRILNHYRGDLINSVCANAIIQTHEHQKTPNAKAKGVYFWLVIGTDTILQ